MMAMIITRCGCSRWIEIPAMVPPPEYLVPMIYSGLLVEQGRERHHSNAENRVFEYEETREVFGRDVWAYYERASTPEKHG